MLLHQVKSLSLGVAKVCFFWGLISLNGGFSPVFAQINQPQQIQFIPKKDDPPDRGTPPSSDGTGSRGDCLVKQNKPPLTRVAGSNALKLTMSKYPTFWVYVPYTPQEAPNGEFSLQDGDKEVYRTRFQLPATPGIVSISLPANVSPLTVGKKYRWYVDISCPRSKVADESLTPASVTGLVQLVTPNSALQNQLKVAKNPLEKIAIYAQNGIWFETVTELAQLRLQEPENSNFKKLWVDLFTSKNVGLSRIANEPIIGAIKNNGQ